VRQALGYRKFFTTYWRDYALGIAALLLTNYLGAWIPWQFKQIIELLQTAHQPHSRLLGVVFMAILTMYSARIASRYLLIGVGRKIEYQLRQQLYAKLFRFPRYFFDTYKTGDVMSRLTNDLNAIKLFLGGALMLLFNVVFAYLTVVPFMWRLSPRLTLCALTLYPLSLLALRWINKRVRLYSMQSQEALSALTATAQEYFSGMSVIQAYAIESLSQAHFEADATQYYRVNFKLVQIRALVYILIAVITGLSLFLVLLEGGRQAMNHQMALSSFAAFMLYIERLSWPTVSVGWVVSAWQQSITSLERVNQLLQLPEKPLHKKELDVPEPFELLEVKDLTFSYQNPYEEKRVEADHHVLKHLDFSIATGDLVLLCGPVGCGKSTLLHLLAGFYPVETGELKLNHHTLTAPVPQLVLMPQSAFLFSDTLENNIRYGAALASTHALEGAIHAAHFHGDLAQLDDGLSTLIGERGVTLSGGQRQRVTLARTLLTEPGLLVLDDPFASVDIETEQALIETLLKRQQAGLTTLLASHRFAIAPYASKILIISQDGQLCGEGRHSDLLASNRTYQNLHRDGNA
jgi:ATP-binding cassette, subfamily B, multidrug efflux pump